MALIHSTAELIRAISRAYAKKWSFLAIFLVVFFATFSVLLNLDIIPNPPKMADTVKETPAVALTAAVTTAIVAPELPTKIEIPSLSLTTTVANPDTTNVEVLDTALLKGAVRYPGSAKLGTLGNVIVFGHSSYLPVVNNKAFKTFDGIQNLKKGDTIRVTGSGTVYTYAVESVVKASAASNAGIPLTVTTNTLTLATCNSFGTKSDRFIVTAKLVGTSLLSS